MNFNLRDISLNWLQQIYIKNGKMIKFCTRINQNKIKELQPLISKQSNLMILHIICNLKYYKDDMVKTMTIELDWNNPDIRDNITSKKEYFYNIIKELEKHQVIWKVRPKTYLVSPDIICYFSYSERTQYHQMLYAWHQYLVGNMDLNPGIVP